jgi:pSer/pThr/pTyr-binding forkhead associated (FHA) protein
VETSGFVVEDLDTPNGTLLNGRRVTSAPVVAGDEIGVGKFTILFNPSAQRLGRLEVRPTASGVRASTEDASTTYLDEQELSRARTALDAERSAHLRPIGAGSMERFPLREATVLGKGAGADIPLRGWLVAARHALIVREGNGYRIRQVGGLRRLRINGKPSRDRLLRDHDRIAIGENRFQFFPAV